MGWVDRKRIGGEHHGLGGYEENRRGTSWVWWTGREEEGNIMGWVDRKRIGREHHGLGGHEENRRGTSWVGWTGGE